MKRNLYSNTIKIIFYKINKIMSTQLKNNEEAQKLLFLLFA